MIFPFRGTEHNIGSLVAIYTQKNVDGNKDIRNVANKFSEVQVRVARRIIPVSTFWPIPSINFPTQEKNQGHSFWRMFFLGRNLSIETLMEGLELVNLKGNSFEYQVWSCVKAVLANFGQKSLHWKSHKPWQFLFNALVPGLYGNRKKRIWWMINSGQFWGKWGLTFDQEFYLFEKIEHNWSLCLMPSFYTEVVQYQKTFYVWENVNCCCHGRSPFGRFVENDVGYREN